MAMPPIPGEKSRAMTNRKLAYIVKDRSPLVLEEAETVRAACRAMWDRRTGSVLVMDAAGQLTGILTGRDVVRLLGKEGDAKSTLLADAMTPKPVTASPGSRAIDALKAMRKGGFRHVPVVEQGKVLGIASRGDFKGMELEEMRWCDHGCVSSQNRVIADIIAGQMLLVLAGGTTVRQACEAMWKRKSGSVLVVDKKDRLSGIFTGRDAVRVLGRAKYPAGMQLAKAMTPRPVTIKPERLAIDALRAMSDGGFRHLPVVSEDGAILGAVSRSDFTGCEIDRLDEEEHLHECIW